MYTVTLEHPTIKPMPDDPFEAAKVIKTLLEANKHRGWGAIVDTPEGQMTLRRLHDLNARHEEAIALARLKTERRRVEQELLAPDDSPLFPDSESAEALMGRTAYSKLNEVQRAQIKDIRPSDVRALQVTDYFGPNTSAKASQLSTTNPGLYRALRTQAIEIGIIA